MSVSSSTDEESGEDACDGKCTDPSYDTTCYGAGIGFLGGRSDRIGSWIVVVCTVASIIITTAIPISASTASTATVTAG